MCVKNSVRYSIKVFFYYFYYTIILCFRAHKFLPVKVILFSLPHYFLSVLHHFSLEPEPQPSFFYFFCIPSSPSPVFLC